MRKPKIGLALGSGAARGWAHVGIIEVLVEAGIEIDIICGTSMGALVGGVHASGQLPALKDWALKADRGSSPRSSISACWPAGSSTGCASSTGWAGSRLRRASKT